MSSIGFRRNDLPQFVVPAIRMFVFFCLPFKKTFLSAQAKKKTFVLLFCSISFAHFSHSAWQLSAHFPTAWLRMIECSRAIISGAACIFHVVAVRSDKVFSDLFRIKSWRSFPLFSLLCNAGCISSDSFLMLFLVIKSDTSQFVSLFLFTTFFWVFGWGIFSVFVAEERLLLAFD